MKCHYEVLNISRDASEDEIKRSYRKLALKFHPDKNPDNIKECTRMFHLIQQAYEVLIDPQERAWYDKHREAIIRGGLAGGGEYEDNSLDVYQYFNTSCYSGYGNDEKGFYAVYSKVFETIAAEDLEFMDNKESDFEFPPFGNAESSYEEVVGPFYAFWESYCTAKSYVWVEKYDTREAPNRQIRRLMEQDNKKLRDKAKKERNEEVRALVAFVRKRDKRVQTRKKYLEERAAEIAKKGEERKRRDLEQRMKELENYTEAGWSAMSALEEDLEKLDATYAEQFGEETEYLSGDENQPEDEDSMQDQYIDDLFCVACNKEFRSEKAFANHEKSKKHKENAAFLKVQMMAEEEAVSDVKDMTTSVAGNEATGGVETTIYHDDNLVESPKTKLSKKQKKKRRQQKLLNKTNKVSDDLKVESLNIDDSTAEEICKNGPGMVDESPVDQKSETDKLPSSFCNSNHDATVTSSDQTEKESVINDVKAFEKKGKKKVQQDSTPQACHKCGQTFSSRNKLFQHIKEMGHALRIEQPTSHTEKNKSKKKNVER